MDLTSQTKPQTPAEKQALQWLADVTEEVEVRRYPMRAEMLHAIDEAARRAESLARLEYALARQRTF